MRRRLWVVVVVDVVDGSSDGGGSWREVEALAFVWEADGAGAG